MVELPEEESGEKRGRWRGNGGLLPLRVHRGVQEAVLGLTGEVAVNVRPPWGIHASAGR